MFSNVVRNSIVQLSDGFCCKMFVLDFLAEDRELLIISSEQ